MECNVDLTVSDNQRELWSQDHPLKAETAGPSTPPPSVTAWALGLRAEWGLKTLTGGGVSSPHSLQLNGKLFLERRSEQCTSMVPRGSRQIGVETLLSPSPSEPPIPLFSRLTCFLKWYSRYLESVDGSKGLLNHEAGDVSREEGEVFKLCVSSL